MNELASIIPTIVFGADWLLRLGLSIRVIMRRRAVGVSLSWLAVILLFPFAGAVIYLLIGENRLGTRRAMRAIEIRERARGWQKALSARAVDVHEVMRRAGIMGLCRQAETVTRMPALGGNELTLIGDPDAIFARLVDDIDAAQESCHLLFYIWTEGGEADRVVDALERAAQRGVTCRALIDAMGGKGFLASASARRLRDAGVEVRAALPVNVVRALFRRVDLRNHRKIVVIDHRIGYTGSQNLADPRLFKSSAGVGHWIDAMVRVEGPAVEVLDGIFLSDWELEASEGFEVLESRLEASPPSPCGDAVVQVVPSGPGIRNDAIHHLLLSTIHAAQRELVMTTPYFVPDESVMDAIICAACRGVDVTLIVPERSDSALVRLASRSHYRDLLDVGVRIMTHRRGLLHTKTVSVDDEVCLIGSVNLDMRSFWLNFEVTLFVYDREFVQAVRELQQSYMRDCSEVQRSTWTKRPLHWRFVENTARLVSPLL